MSLLTPATDKRLNSDYYAEGWATTFNQPYVIWEDEGIEFKEQVDANAFQTADMTDVIMQYDHYGRVFARNKMGSGKPPTLIVEPQERGLFVA